MGSGNRLEDASFLDNAAEKSADNRLNLHAVAHDAGYVIPGEARLQLVADAHNPGDATKAEQMTAAALAAYNKIDDPKAALQATEPQFKAAVQQADSDAAATLQQIGVEAQRIAPQFQAAAAKQETAVQNLAEQFSKVPEDQQAKVTKLLDAWASVDPGDPVRTAVEKDLSRYPDLLSAAKVAEKATDDPVLKQAAQLEGTAELVIKDQAMSRLAYAKALSAGGREYDSFQQISQACKILGLPQPQSPYKTA